MENKQYVYINNSYQSLEQIWNDNVIPILNDGIEEYVVPKDELFVKCIDDNGSIVDRKIEKLCKRKVNFIKNVIISDKTMFAIADFHKLLTVTGWSNILMPEDDIKIANNDMSGTKIVSIITIQKIPYNGYVYCLQVEEYNNYVIDGIPCQYH
jgi:hypothetical protein